MSPPVHDFHTAVHSAGTAASPRATSEGFNLRNLSSGHGRRTREPAEAGGTELQAFDSGRYSLHCTQSVGVRHLSKPHLPSLPGKHSRTQQQSFVLWATRLAAEADAAKGCSVSMSRLHVSSLDAQHVNKQAGVLSLVPASMRGAHISPGTAAAWLVSWHRSCQRGVVGPVLLFALVPAALTRAEPALTLATILNACSRGRLR